MAILDWRPLSADVGSILRARTKDRDGNELGDFTSSTRPTGQQVDTLVEVVVSDIEGQVGTVPEELQPLARYVATVGTACLVLLSYWPEQIGDEGSPYE